MAWTEIARPKYRREGLAATATGEHHRTKSGRRIEPGISPPPARPWADVRRPTCEMPSMRSTTSLRSELSVAVDAAKGFPATTRRCSGSFCRLAQPWDMARPSTMCC